MRLTYGLCAPMPPSGAPASDDRVDAVFVDGRPVATIKRSRAGVTVTIKAKDDPGFHAWLREHAETLLTSLHQQWTAERDHPTEEAR